MGPILLPVEGPCAELHVGFDSGWPAAAVHRWGVSRSGVRSRRRRCASRGRSRPRLGLRRGPRSRRARRSATGCGARRAASAGGRTDGGHRHPRGHHAAYAGRRRRSLLCVGRRSPRRPSDACGRTDRSVFQHLRAAIGLPRRSRVAARAGLDRAGARSRRSTPRASVSLHRRAVRPRGGARGQDRDADGGGGRPRARHGRPRPRDRTHSGTAPARVPLHHDHLVGGQPARSLVEWQQSCRRADLTRHARGPSDERARHDRRHLARVRPDVLGRHGDHHPPGAREPLLGPLARRPSPQHAG